VTSPSRPLLGVEDCPLSAVQVNDISLRYDHVFLSNPSMEKNRNDKSLC